MALLSGVLALLLAPRVLGNRNAVGQTPIMGWSGCEYTALLHSRSSLTQINPASALTHPATQSLTSGGLRRQRVHAALRSL